MTEISNLIELLKGMKPELADGEFVFCTISEIQLAQFKINPLLTFKEKEGITIIIEKKTADKNSLPYRNSWSWIVLTVHSDLLAVGFLARITNELAKAGISVNAVSAYYHDHLFVPTQKANEAMKLLEKLAQS